MLWLIACDSCKKLKRSHKPARHARAMSLSTTASGATIASGVSAANAGLTAATGRPGPSSLRRADSNNEATSGEYEHGWLDIWRILPRREAKLHQVQAAPAPVDSLYSRHAAG